MATTYGAPTGLDLSACNVTATGGSTSQTLADLSKSVNDNSTAISTVSSEAASANNIAASANTTAQAAQTAVSNLGNTYIPQTSIGVASGVVGTDSGNGVSIPVATDGAGYLTYTTAATESYIWMSSTQYTIAGSASPNTVQGRNAGLHFGGAPRTINGTATATAYLEIAADVLQPFHITTDLGQSDAAWANIYSVTAVQVTSDENYKTIAGTIGDASYGDGEKLASALMTVDPKVYQLNDAITSKGTDDARFHVGYIAQDVEAAITAAGLNPSKFAMWTNSPQYELVETDSGKKDAEGNVIYTWVRQPKLGTDGKQEYKQMLRYEELLCVIVQGLKDRLTASEATIASLTSRVAALESKIAINTSSTSGSAA